MTDTSVGGFGPADNLPTWLATIGEHAPFGAAVAALSDSWVGVTPQWEHLVALGTTTVVSAVAAAKLFRWD